MEGAKIDINPPPSTPTYTHTQALFKFSSDKLFNELNIFFLKRTRKSKRYLKIRTCVQGIRNLRVDGLEGSICNNNFLCGLYYIVLRAGSAPLCAAVIKRDSMTNQVCRFWSLR